MTNAIIDQIAERQRSLETYLKSSGDRFRLPSLFGRVHKIGDGELGYTDPAALAVVEEIDQSQMLVPWIVSTIDRDRDGDIVVPEGCIETLDQYKINPQIFFGHRADSMPIARAEYPDGRLAIDIEPGRCIRSIANFNCRTQDSEDIFHLVVNGDLRMASIGFYPIVAERLKDLAKAQADPSPRQQLPGWRFLKWTLLEWSVVGVPSNPFAECVRRYLSLNRITGKAMSAGLRKSLEPYAAAEPIRTVGGWESPKPSEADMSKKWRKAAKPKKVREVLAAKAIPSGLNETAGPEGGAVVKPDGPKKADATDTSAQHADVQSVSLPKDKFPQEMDARRWIETHELDPANLKDAGDRWECEQFDAGRCEDAIRDATLVDGVQGKVCKARAADAAGPHAVEQQKSPRKESLRVLAIDGRECVVKEAADGSLTRMELDPKMGRFVPLISLKPPIVTEPIREKSQPKKKGTSMKTPYTPAKNKAGKVVTKDDTDVTDEGTPKTDAETQTPPADDSAKMPLGAKVSLDCIAHLDEVELYFENVLPQLEPDSKIREYLAGEFRETLLGLCDSLKQQAEETYPEVDFGNDAAPDDEDEDEDEDNESADLDTDNEDAANDDADAEDDDVDEEQDNDATTDTGDDTEGDIIDTVNDDEEDDDEAKAKRAKTLLRKYAERGRELRHKPSIGKRLSRRKAAVIKDAADHLDMAANHSYGHDQNVDKMVCSAHRYHAKELREMVGAYDKDDAEPATTEAVKDDESAGMGEEEKKLVASELAEIYTHAAATRKELNFHIPA